VLRSRQRKRYNSASEVVREALRLLEEHDATHAAQLAEFNDEVGRRLASLDRGDAVDPTAARARLRRKSVQRRKSGGGAIKSSLRTRSSIGPLLVGAYFIIYCAEHRPIEIAAVTQGSRDIPSFLHRRMG
jgi:antitoxin ParD1/3/4